MVSFVEAVRLFYKNYAKFEGRSCRSEYWWVALYQILAVLILAIPGYPWLFENWNELMMEMPTTDLSTGALIAISLIGLAFITHIIPIIALDIRRWHDLDRSGWYFLIFAVLGMIPIIGSVFDLVNLIWFMFRGTNGPNNYGVDPFGDTADIFN